MNRIYLVLLVAIAIALAACSHTTDPKPTLSTQSCNPLEDPGCFEVVLVKPDFGIPIPPDPPCLNCPFEVDILIGDWWEDIVISVSLADEIGLESLNLLNTVGETLAKAELTELVDGELGFKMELAGLEQGHYRLQMIGEGSARISLRGQFDSLPLNIIHSLPNADGLTRALEGTSAIVTNYGDAQLAALVAEGFAGGSTPDMVIHRTPHTSDSASAPVVTLCTETCQNHPIFRQVADVEPIGIDVLGAFVHEAYLEEYGLESPQTQEDIVALANANAVCMHSDVHGWCGNEIPSWFRSFEPDPQPWYTLFENIQDWLSFNPQPEPPAVTMGLMSELFATDSELFVTTGLATQYLTPDDDPNDWGPILPWVRLVELEDLTAQVLVTQVVINGAGNIRAAQAVTEVLLEPATQQTLFETTGQLPVNNDVLAALSEQGLWPFVDYVADYLAEHEPPTGTDDDPFGARAITDIISMDEPPKGVVRINDHMTVEFIGKAALTDGKPQTSDEGVRPERGRDSADEVPAGDAQYRQVAFNVLNSRTLNQFELVIEQPLLTSVHDYQVARGLASGSEGVDSPRELEARFTRPEFAAEGLATQGWSNGTDNRLLRSPTTLYPWRTIAQHGSGDSTCSSTLVGPRHLITAAHCINERGTTNWYTVRVDPGRNGLNNSPYGSSTIKINPDPGTEAWYFTPSAWRSQWCVDNPYACNQWDWGMIVIPDRLGDMTGWMGYWAGPGSFLEQQTLYNRGYPSCTTTRPNKPALCDDDYGTTYWARLWGDRDCDIGQYLYQGSDSWNRVLKVDCDLSAGHSGSPIYFYVDTDNGRVPVVTAVATWEECTTCNSNISHPNLVRRITPSDLNVISWLRNVFP